MLKEDYDKSIRKYINEKMERRVVFAVNVSIELKPEIDEMSFLGEVPVIWSYKTETDWTNVAPIFELTATDYLYGTTNNGSGVESIVIRDESGKEVKKGTDSVNYTLDDKYEGIHSFTIEVKDKVGHIVAKTVTTNYDKTPPNIEDNEQDFVYNGENVSGYCQDNVFVQNNDDSPNRSPAEHTSGIKNVIMYGVKNGKKTAISEDTTLKVFLESDETATFHLYYDCNDTDDKYEYYLVVVRDFAGNLTQKKLVSQKALLSWFRTSIEGEGIEYVIVKRFG